MGQFAYKAIDRAGQRISGVIEAADRKGAVAALAGQGELVVEISRGGYAADRYEDTKENKGRISFSDLAIFKSGRVSGTDILAVTSQLNAALRAGLPLLEALKIIRDQQQKTLLKGIIDKLVSDVSGGKSLSEAMAEHSKVFSELYISMIRVGETGGILDQTTSQLVMILQRDEKVKTSMRNASAYPLFVLSVGIISVIVIIIWVLPNILATITDSQTVLPWPTRLLLAISGFISSFGWFVLVIAAAGGYWLKKWCGSTGRTKFDSLKLRIPILGSVLRTIAVGRFARTLGALTSGGVGILESLAIVRDTLGNDILADQIDIVAEKVKTGEPLATPLGQSGYFPPLLVQIVAIGEQTGKLDELLLGAAQTFDEQADSAIAKFIAVFPAILILLLALVIGFIIAATLLPIVMMELGAGAF